MTEKAMKTLAKCEADLRALVASAAGTGDYDEVMRIASLAKQISAMSAGHANVEQRKPTAPSQRPGGKYPRFLRRGDQLVKVGWSKRDKTEYEHKALGETVAALAALAAEVGKDGRIFQISDLLTMWTKKNSTAISDYQIYLVVAWWRSAGIVDQHGRQGYSLAKADQFAQGVESAWAKLTVE